MNGEQILASFGLGDLVVDEFFFTQIGVLALTGLFFLGALALCIMAMRAASSAKKSKNSAREFASSMQDIAAEMRQLTAQMERASYKGSSDNHTTTRDKQDSEAEVEILHDEDGQRNADTASDKALSKAKRAAIEPSALLRGFLRRR
jgi:hypothetical protein